MTTDTLQPDPKLDLSLRPTSWEGFIGHSGVKRALGIFQQAAQRRGRQLGHVLLDGMSGCGKTTLAGIMATTANRKLHVVNCANLDTFEDFITNILDLKDGDFILADECHACGPKILEGMYHLVEDGRFDGIYKGDQCHVKLPEFTMVACTTRAGMLPKPFINRFEITQTVEFYSPEDLALILAQSCRKLGIAYSDEALAAIAKRARGTPRIVNMLLKRCDDFAMIEGNGNNILDLAEVNGCMSMLGIDGDGLDALDRKILTILANSTRPIGIASLANGLQVDTKTVQEIKEPWLFYCGFISRLSNGRVITEKGRAKVNA